MASAGGMQRELVHGLVVPAEAADGNEVAGGDGADDEDAMSSGGRRNVSPFSGFRGSVRGRSTLRRLRTQHLMECDLVPAVYVQIGANQRLYTRQSVETEDRGRSTSKAQ